MKKRVNYAGIRGFNYTQPDSRDDRDFWLHYSHETVDRDMGYAERLRLNSARIFLSYSAYRDDPDSFFAHVRDFVRTAWSHGISTNPIVYHGAFFFPMEEEFRPVEGETLPPLAKTVRTPESGGTARSILTACTKRSAGNRDCCSGTFRTSPGIRTSLSPGMTKNRNTCRISGPACRTWRNCGTSRKKSGK